jgi:hypothetical protein
MAAVGLVLVSLNRSIIARSARQKPKHRNRGLRRQERYNPAAMTRLYRRYLFALLCAGFGSVAAEDVYKCTDAKGDISFQDRPCPANTQESQLHLRDAPPVAPPPAVVVDAAPAAATAAVPPPPAPRAPLPALWVCQNAEDGSNYFSENGSPPVRYVPLGTLGFPGKSLGQAYGPGGGSGISAPGVNPIPISRSPRDAIATQLTALQDACVPAAPAQTCGWLRKQYEDVEHKLKRAFKDERAVLEPRERELEAQLDNC